MRSLPVLAELPRSYLVETGERGAAAWRSDLADELRRSGFRADGEPSLRESDLVGRRPLHELGAAGQVFLVRRYHHGGLLRWATGLRFLDPERPFRELVVAAALLEAGVRTPELVAARAVRAPLLGYRLELAMRRVPDALDLGYVLGLACRGELPRSVRAAILEAAGALVRELHRAGCLHADLTPNNMLVNRTALEGAPPELWILDLERSVLGGAPSDGARRRNLRRLYRFVARRSAGARSPITLADRARFLRGYDPGRRAWKEDWRAVSGAHGWTLAPHALGWMLERLFGSAADPRREPAAPDQGAGSRSRSPSRG